MRLYQNVLRSWCGACLVNFRRSVSCRMDGIGPTASAGTHVLDCVLHLVSIALNAQLLSPVFVKETSTLVFCRSIVHANRLQKFFRQFDIGAAVLHSELHRSDRFINLSNFRMGKIKVLISIEMLNEGIDVPEVNIVVFARVTHSRRIFLQQLGRGLRLNDNKTHVTVLDFVADVRRIAAGYDLNAAATDYKEDVNYPDGDIVKFSKYSQDFFTEYLADMANIEDLDEDAHLDFPDTE